MIDKNECVNKVPFQVKRILSISQVQKKACNPSKFKSF